jgi:dolichyl-diphosphooligosaccharide--protein glycosyltransferase
LGFGVAGQVLAWAAGPLLLVPLAVGVAAFAPFAVVHDRVDSFGPIVAGLALGALVALLAHVGLGWHSFVVAVVPGLLALGALGVALVAFVAGRRSLSPLGLVAVELVIGCVVALGLFTRFPDLVAELERGVAFLVRSSPIGEMQSVTDQWGVVFGPLIMLGFTPFLAVPAMLWSVWDGLTRRTDYGWLLLGGYAFTFFGLSFVQRRFTGELAPFVAVFAALGFVVLVSKLDLAYGPRFLRTRHDATTERPAGRTRDDDLAIPGRRRFVMLGGFAAVFAGFPSVFSGAIYSRLTIDPRKHAAAQWMGEYADDRGWEFPRSYVFSEWGVNRMFNYFANGHSESYWYAQRNYEDFLFSSEPRAWYEELRGRAGFVVTTGPESQFVTSRMKDRLHDGLGSRANDVRGLAHYRAVYSGADGYVKVFTVVPGATIAGTVDDERDDPVTVRTEVALHGEGETFTYERVAAPDDQSRFAVTVPHPGTYRVGGRRVTVTERAVADGETVAVDDSVERS